MAFRSGDEVELQSKSGQTLTRYFPEIEGALLSLKPSRFVLDGELIVPVNGHLSFDDLLQRIHPADSRVQMLSRKMPAHFVAFDFLVDEKGASLVDFPLVKRRHKLEGFARRYFPADGAISLSLATNDRDQTLSWLKTLRGQLDGIIAKKLDDPYQSGVRAMLKVKNIRTADCVVGGFRYASAGRYVGSLLLGLYNKGGLLNHVGFTSSIARTDRAEVTRRLEALGEAPGFTGQAPGGPSRWSTDRSAEWEPLKPVLVVEVQYDHFTGARFRHGTKLLRWRPDKDPLECTVAQVTYESKVPFTHLLQQT